MRARERRRGARRVAAAPGRSSAPERLVGLGFRYWLTGFRTRRHLLLGEGLVRLLQRAGRRRRQGRRHRPLLLGARHQPPCPARPRDRRRRLRPLLPRRMHRHRDDLGLPAQRLPGHARVRLRAARLLDDRRGRRGRGNLRCDHARRRPGLAAILQSWFIACWRCRRPAPCDSEQLGKSASMIVCSCLVITDERYRAGPGRDPEPARRAAADAGRRLSPSAARRWCAAAARRWRSAPSTRRSTSWRRRAWCAPTPAPARRAACSSAPATRPRSA